MADRFDNKINPTTTRYKPTIRKVSSNSVPFGSDISLNGRTVWVALDGDKLIAVAATSAEVRVKYREALRREQRRSA